MAAARDAGLTAYRWVPLGAFTSGSATALATIFAFGLLLPDISDELGLSPSQEGLLGASAVFGNIALAIPLNEWLSRYRTWRVVLLCFLGISAFTLLQGWSPTLAVFIVGRIGLGVCQIALQAPRALLIQQWSSAVQIPFTQAAMYAGTTIIWGLALMAARPLLNLVGGWREVLYIMGGVGAAASLLWLLVGRERVTAEFARGLQSQDRSPLLSILKYRQLWLLGLAQFAATMSVTSFDVFWPKFAVENLKVDPVIAGFSVGIVMLVGGPGGAVLNSIPWLAQRQPVLLALAAATIIGTNVGLLHISWVPALLLVSVARGLIHVYFPAINTLVYQLPGVRPREIAAAMAVTVTCAWTGGAVGPMIVGFVEDATGDPRLALYTMSFTPVLGIALAFVIYAIRSRAAPRAATQEPVKP